MTDRLVHMPEPGKPFSFDASVAPLFDDMAQRSIMGYEIAATAVERICRQLDVPNFSQAWDMGTSTGRMLRALRSGFDHYPTVDFWGTDISEPMIAQAQANHPFARFVVADLREGFPAEFKPGKIGALVWGYTLQFIDDEQRWDLLDRSFDALAPGGALFVFEKYRLPNAVVDRAAQGAYIAARRANGYTVEEIEAKTIALEGVMRPALPEETVQALRNAGATRIEPVYQVMNFGGFVAFKD